jgi:hypothetical protein
MSTITQLITKEEVAPPSLGIVAVQNPTVAVDATGIYFNQSYTGVDGAPPPTGHMVHVAFSGERKVLADAIHPANFVLAGDDVIYIADYALRAVPRAGGTAHDITPLANNRPNLLAATAERVYFDDDTGTKVVALPAGTPSLVSSLDAFSGSLIGGDLVLADFNTGTVERISTANGAIQPIATGQLGPLYPLACGNAICWMNAGDANNPGSIMRFAPGGSPEVVATHAALHHPHGFVFDGTDFYVTSDAFGGALTRVHAADGSVHFLSGLPGDGTVAVDDQCAYFSDFDGIFSIAKDSVVLQ